MTSPQAILEAEGLSFSYGERDVFRGLDLGVAAGEVVAVFGPSGCGKSTALKACAGLLHPRAGRVRIWGQDIHALGNRALQSLRRRMGFVFQDGALIANMNVHDNLALPLRYRGEFSEAEIEAEIEAVFMLFELEEFRASLPAQLSIGIRKEVSLARAFISRPDLVFYDDPFSGLDDVHALAIQDLIRKMRQERSVAALLATDRFKDAYALADRIVMIHQGRVVLAGTGRDFLGSADPEVRRFALGKEERPAPAKAEGRGARPSGGNR